MRNGVGNNNTSAFEEAVPLLSGEVAMCGEREVATYWKECDADADSARRFVDRVRSIVSGCFRATPVHGGMEKGWQWERAGVQESLKMSKGMVGKHFVSYGHVHMREPDRNSCKLRGRLSLFPLFVPWVAEEEEAGVRVLMTAVGGCGAGPTLSVGARGRVKAETERERY